MAEDRDNTQNAADKHAKARELAEKALEAYGRSDQETGDRLAEQAKQLDRSAVEELLEEIEDNLASMGNNPAADQE